jgi:tetratricopeptide (TPR) repeat protein
MMPLLLPLLPLIAQVGPFSTVPGASRSTPVEQGVVRKPRGQADKTVPLAPPPEARSSRGKECAAQVDEDAEQAADMAQAWLAEGVRGPGERAEANLCLGLAQSRLGAWGEAETAFLAGRDAAGADRMLRARLGAMAGNAALAAGADARALAALDGAKADAAPLGDAGLSAGIALDRARALVGLKRPDEAGAALAEARAATPDNAEAWLLSATLSRRQGKLAEAQAQIVRAAELLPIDPAIGLEAGVIAMLAGHQEAARKSWASVVTAAPDSAEAATAKGYLAQLGPAPAVAPSRTAKP